ncbi:hypothetical protein EW145_g509 [Phellinidium pouzarii]|uniref:VWFA domain-containing protein n=1 Tax=Phellinidium pouzarii TaxID=167371 RepID=A0A4S4LJW3_9AGAM|nr:hypothetical protein EW145_g509 [Phellinidium pouzarii]
MENHSLASKLAPSYGTRITNLTSARQSKPALSRVCFVAVYVLHLTIYMHFILMVQFISADKNTSAIACKKPLTEGMTNSSTPRCKNCDYLCTLPQGHPQAEHSTNHGSMSRARWAVDGPDGVEFELDGHKFGSNDDGSPMLCNLVCSNMGRHIHIDHCRAGEQECKEPGTHHITHPVLPNPDLKKDWVTHKLFWKRLDFRDPYSREEQATFSKYDAMCSGPEHQKSDSTPAQPSYCSLFILHPPTSIANVSSTGGSGYMSYDGHAFLCKNPAVLQQAFHVIFVIDKSGSMAFTDRQPLLDHPGTTIIQQHANNRLGAVFSSLHSFWMARLASVSQAAVAVRRDAYSTILFASTATEVFSNDFSSTPDELLNKVLPHPANGDTNFTAALRLAGEIMDKHWSTERAPVIIFLSDGDVSSREGCFVSFCVIWQRQIIYMATIIAKEVQSSALRDPLLPEGAVIESSYNVVLDSVKLTDIFGYR